MVSGLELRSLITREGQLRLSLEERELPEPGPDEVLIRVEAAPLNPTDHFQMTGPADFSTLAAENRLLTMTVPSAALPAVSRRLGESRAVGPYGVTMTGIRPVIGPNWSAVAADLRITRGEGGTPFILSPESRFFASPPTTTNESAIATRLDGQLYTVLGQPDGKGGWQVRLWWKPFVTLIWLGGALIAFGGFLSFLGRIRRRKRAVYEGDEEYAA